MLQTNLFYRTSLLQNSLKVIMDIPTENISTGMEDLQEEYFTIKVKTTDITEKQQLITNSFVNLCYEKRRNK